MKLVAQRLGLSADASEDSILAALDKLSNRATAAETQVTTLTGENTELKNRNATMLDDQIADELAAAGITDEAKRAKLTPVLKAMKNREERVSFIEECVAKPAAAQQAEKPTFNRAAGKQPARAAATEPTPAEKFRADFLANRAGGKSKSEALDLAMAGNPDGYKAWRDANGQPGL